MYLDLIEELGDGGLLSPRPVVALEAVDDSLGDLLDLLLSVLRHRLILELVQLPKQAAEVLEKLRECTVVVGLAGHGGDCVSELDLAKRGRNV